MWHECGTEGMRAGFCCANMWGRNRLKIINTDIKMTLNWILKITAWEDVDWIHLA